jgi:hypothetical protein
MAATSNIGITRECLKTIIAAVFTAQTLDPTRVKVGLDDLAASEDFFKDIITNKPMCVVRPATIEDANLQTRLIDYTIKVKLYIGFAADADYTYEAAENLNNAIQEALMLYSNYTAGASKPIFGMSSDLDEEISMKPRVICYTWTLKFQGVTTPV